MIITSIKVRNLHGYINHQLQFQPGVNILVGINGSGKTSVLNALAWSLSPDDVHSGVAAAYRLAALRFDEIDVAFVDAEGSTERHVRVTASNDALVWTLEGTKGTLAIPKPRDTDRSYTMARRPSRIDEPPDFVADYLLAHRTNAVLVALGDLGGPLYLPLDRRWAEPLEPEYRRRDPPYSRQSPVSHAIWLAERSYRREQTEVALRNEELRQRIIASQFEKPPSRPETPPSVAQVREDRSRINRVLTALGISEASQTTAPYFEALEKTATALAGKKFNRKLSPQNPEWQHWVDWLTTGAYQAGQIQKLLATVQTYEERTQEVTRVTSSFLRLMNSFLEDTRKKLEFDSAGDLAVSREQGPSFGAASLSSGELQLLTLFSFLHFQFHSKQRFAIIIDEPELSLHLHWQERYIDSVKEANPDAQLILATHFPEIIGSYDNCCIDLSPGVASSVEVQ